MYLIIVSQKHSPKRISIIKKSEYIRLYSANFLVFHIKLNSNETSINGQKTAESLPSLNKKN